MAEGAGYFCQGPCRGRALERRSRQRRKSTLTPRAVAATAAALALSVTLLTPRPARADDTIKHPGDHPKYHVEIEPHALLGWGVGVYPGSGLGFGARFSIPLVDNGFISEINNNVAISFGADFLYFNACWHDGGCSATYLQFPVVMQWNFFVAQRWSVFGEPGVVIYHGFFDDCPPGVHCGGVPVATGIEPAIFVGGRYHLSEGTSLTMRIGFPAFSFGFSFFL